MSVAPVSSVTNTQSELARLRVRASELAKAAEQDDVSEAFPQSALAILRETGCLRAVLPSPWGGVGLGWTRSSTEKLKDLLRAIGGVHLSAARLFEGHVNAFQLLWLYGTPDQRDCVCAYVRSGELLGVWNAPSSRGPLVLNQAANERLRLVGGKAYASGAGYIRRPLVTATHAELGLVIVWPDASYEVGSADEWCMHGMRASFTRSVDFDCIIHNDQIFGSDNDYHAQPYFSGGAWRFLAAQLGAGEALVEWMREALLQKHREQDTHQQIRLAKCVASLETARKWVTDAAHYMDDDRPIDEVVQHANEARIIVEHLLLDIMEQVHRGVGLPSFSRRSPIERIARDLATYLRQPAPDALLNAVGETAFAHALPGLLGGNYASE